MNSTKSEHIFLKNLHLKIIILTGILAPCLTASGAYFGLKAKIEEKDRLISDRVSTLELTDNKTYIDKDSFNHLSNKVDVLSNQSTEILVILRARRHVEP